MGEVCARTGEECMVLTAAVALNRLSVSGDPDFRSRVDRFIKLGESISSATECGVNAMAGALALQEAAVRSMPYSLPLSEYMLEAMGDSNGR